MEDLTTDTGWTCPVCSQYVGSDEEHLCPGPPQDHRVTLNPADPEVLRLLGKIAKDIGMIRMYIVNNRR